MNDFTIYMKLKNNKKFDINMKMIYVAYILTMFQ